jgi:hypothetical protein
LIDNDMQKHGIPATAASTICIKSNEGAGERRLK